MTLSGMIKLLPLFNRKQHGDINFLICTVENGDLVKIGINQLKKAIEEQL